jgi:hypothetical protein
MSLPSTAWVLPSYTVTRMSCTGKPATTPSANAWRTPFSTAAMNTPGMAPPLTTSTNSKPAPALQRLHAQHDLAELAGTAALLLVAAVTFGGRGDGLAVGDLRRAGVEFQLVLLLHAVSLARRCISPRPRITVSLVCGVALDLEAGVFQLQLVQNLEQALLVALAPGLHGQALHGLGKLQRFQVDVVFVVRIVQHAVEFDLLDLGHRADVTGHQREGTST